MRIIKKLTPIEKENILNDFYKQFETGFDFEDFLKPFLESLGLSEVSVTKKTGDGGIDLLAIRRGVIDGEDDIQYVVQAKRYKPSNSVLPRDIDALRGNLRTNQKGIFITTGKVSKEAIENGLEKDPNRPVIVFDGKRLVDKLIDLQIGFVFKPVFSVDALNEYIDNNVNANKNVIVSNDENQNNHFVSVKNAIKKTITANDIRAGIISIPRGIVDNFKNNKTKRPVECFVNGKKYNVTFAPGRNYLGGVTQILRDFNLKCSDGTFKEKEVFWTTDGDSFEIVLKN